VREVVVEVVVRRATAVDAPALARLRWRWRVEERGETGDIDREPFVDFFEGWTLDHTGSHVPFIAEVDGQIAGMAWLSLGDRVPSPQALDRRSGDIQSVYVVPELRRHSVGARLIAAAVQHARDVELVYLTVHSAVDAIGFYERLGFVDNGQWLAYPLDR
jgi:ribosomal protein S18 acetylase RimI-like enzyme